MASYEIAVSQDASNATRVTLYQKRRKRSDDYDDDSDSEPHASEEAREQSETLDNSSEFKTVCRGHSYQKTKFGRDAKTRIAECTGALERNDAQPWNYLFLTGTLPSDSEWAKWAVAEYSDWIINCMKAWLSKRMSARLELYVWEMQERGALHFHWLLYCPDQRMRLRLTMEFRLEWCKLLGGVTKQCGISMWGRFESLSSTAKYCIVQVKVEQVRESVAKYMAGYCGTGKNKHEKDRFIPYYPRRWFGVCRTLSTLAKQYEKKDVLSFPNYRAAKIAFDEMGNYFGVDVDYEKKYRHTVGMGETSVHYHSHETQEQLWQSRKAMIYNQKQHPIIWSLIRTAYSIVQMCGELEISSQPYAAQYSKSVRDVLGDGLYKQSLSRGSLRLQTTQAIEKMFLESGLDLSLHPSLRPLLSNCDKFVRLRSRYFPQMRWNQHGWLNNTDDFNYVPLNVEIQLSTLDRFYEPD